MPHVPHRRRAASLLALLTLLALVVTAAWAPAASAGRAAQAGPGGRLSGRVVDHASGDPVAGASVVLTGPSSKSTVTDADGRYVVNVAPGDYELLITAFGFDDVRHTVRVRANSLMVLDVQLDSSPLVVLKGNVADASGAGWPLYAHVELAGTPLQTFTDPVTGDYRLMVPGGHTYDVAVSAGYPGYQPRSDQVRVEQATTHDVGLEADAGLCTAPGYARVGGLHESFDDSTTPAGWTVVDHHGAGVLWRFDDPAHRGNLTGGAGGFATVDSVDQTTSLPDVSLVAPAADLSAAEHPVLEFGTELLTGFPAMAKVELSIDGGTTWATVWSTQASVPGPKTVRVPLPTAVGVAAAQVRFHYLRGPGRWWWQVDDVYLGDTTCAPTASGLVVGNTRSSLTGRPLTDVDVTADGAAPVTSTANARRPTPAGRLLLVGDGSG